MQSGNVLTPEFVGIFLKTAKLKTQIFNETARKCNSDAKQSTATQLETVQFLTAIGNAQPNSVYKILKLQQLSIKKVIFNVVGVSL